MVCVVPIFELPSVFQHQYLFPILKATSIRWRRLEMQLYVETMFWFDGVLLPNLTEITIRTGGHSAPSRLRRLVREMMHARAAPSTINGRDVVVLERVVTDFDYASEAEQEVDG